MIENPSLIDKSLLPGKSRLTFFFEEGGNSFLEVFRMEELNRFPQLVFHSVVLCGLRGTSWAKSLDASTTIRTPKLRPMI